MKFSLIAIVLLFITLNSFGQITFESGYFIDNQDQRFDCLIKNIDWKENPKEFEYKISTDQEVKKGDISNVKEFGITGWSRFVRADVKMDMSPMDIDKLSKKRNPEWLDQTLFLKVLVEGKASLYYYENDGLLRLFYSTSDLPINQLIYKDYYDTTQTHYVLGVEYTTNNKFHDQLWTEVRCSNTGTSEIEQLNYRRSDLERYFIKYNECSGNTPVVYGKKGDNKSFHLKICPGLNYSHLSVSNDVFDKYDMDFGNKLNLRLGLEAEYVLPFNKNKWGFLFEPTFQYFYAEEENSMAIVTIHYNTIEFPFGLRYYFFLNPELKLYANAFYIPSYSLGINSTFEYQTTISSIEPITRDLETAQSFAFGGGIAYKKITAELRYYTNEDLFNNYPSWHSDFQKVALILGFRFF